MKLSKNKKIWIKGLVMECPAGHPVADCPLNPLRHLPIPEANRIINNLTTRQIHNYMQTHRNCYNHRAQ